MVAANDDREANDAKRVDEAVQALTGGNFERAEAILRDVIANTPASYANSTENSDESVIKFWDRTAFLHYVTWQRDHGKADRSIQWVGNAYPRAHYYMGFLSVKRQQWDAAIDYLDRGQRLERTNPMFIFEKAKALVHAGRKPQALALYDQVTEVGPYISGRHLAIARRGRGFVLIEMGDLDGAQRAFQASLEIEPDNEVALHELQYIEHLRSGGAAGVAGAVTSTDPDPSLCMLCGQRFQKGIVVSFKGMPVTICNRCDRKMTKKWWQFWK